MTKTLKKFAGAAIGIVVLSTSLFAAAPEGWQDDVDAAIALAKKENKSVMVEFTGSDWCPPCIMMAKKVFSKEEFVSKASEDFVLVHLDFPKGDKELSKKNEPAAKRFNITGFPTVVLLDSEGKEFTRFFASQFPEVDLFLAHLGESLEKKDLD